MMDLKETVLEALRDCKFIGVKKVHDVYFYDPLRKNLQPMQNDRLLECCRLRTKNDHAFLTYKIDHFDAAGLWRYSDEHEVEVSSAESARQIYESLGLKVLVEIENEKHTFENEFYEIVLEDVKQLGLFMEVEVKCTHENTDVEAEKAVARQFVNNLGLHVEEELLAGKPELMLKHKKSLNAKK